jgi:hypothetical protein
MELMRDDLPGDVKTLEAKSDSESGFDLRRCRLSDHR